MARTEYSTDDGLTWVTATAAGVSFTSEGTHVVQYRSVDVAGNVEATRAVTLTVADPGGVATATLSSVDQPSADGWYTATVRVGLQAPAPSQTVQYRRDGGAWQDYTAVIAVAASGVTLLDHRLVSAGGSVVPGSEAQVQVKVDKVAPTRAVTRSPTATGTPRNPVTLTFSGIDRHSGLDRVEYRLGGGDWVTAGGPLVVVAVGAHTITYRSVDVAGNVSAERSVAVTIKADPPTAVRSAPRARGVARS